MVYLLIVVTGMVTIASAVRSTWSPCGLSMLATITPLSQRGRGHGYPSTVAWFVTGSTVGGATLGAGMAALSVGVSALSLTAHEVAAIVVGASVVAVASDLGVGGFELPVHHRQVNERWLDQFRVWVYGAGFGWQIGTGLVTYIMSASVYLMIVLSALVGSPWLAVAFGTLFGLVRGCAVLLGRGITSVETLRAFHLLFERLGPVVRRVTIGVAHRPVGAVMGRAGSGDDVLGMGGCPDPTVDDPTCGGCTSRGSAHVHCPFVAGAVRRRCCDFARAAGSKTVLRSKLVPTFRVLDVMTRALSVATRCTGSDFGGARSHCSGLSFSPGRLVAWSQKGVRCIDVQ